MASAPAAQRGAKNPAPAGEKAVRRLSQLPLLKTVLGIKDLLNQDDAGDEDEAKRRKGEPIGNQDKRKLAQNARAASLGPKVRLGKRHAVLLQPEAKPGRRGHRKVRQQGEVLEAADLSELAEEIRNCAGFFIDFLQRSYSALGEKGASEKRGGEHMAKILEQQQLDDVNGFDFATSAVCRERLRSYIMDGVVRECKRRGIFKRTGKEAMQHWCSYVVKCKRETMCMRVEVSNWMWRWRLLHLVDRMASESVWEKKDRLEEFWSTFHDRSRVLESTKGFASRRPGLAGPPPPAGTCGLRWDFEQGMHWKAAKVGPGGSMIARPGTQSQAGLPKGLTLGAGGSVRQGQALGKTASLPSLHKTASEDTFQSFSRPMSRTSPKAQAMLMGRLPPISTSRHRYLQECDSHKRPPIPLTFVTGHTNVFTATGKDLVDSELLTMSAMIQEMDCVPEVNLCDNALLTDKGLVPLLKQLSREPVRSTLHRLNLGHCIRAGPYTVDATIKLLKCGGALRVLDLSQVPIAARFQLPLCQAIGKHNTLEVVSLAEAGFQHHEMTKDCLKALLSGKILHTLDLSWNCFNGDVCKALGGLVVGHVAIRSLSLANCSAASDTCPVEDFVSPLSRFVELLAHDTTLTKLDISMNRCEFSTALILEDALDSHRKLRELALNHNPLGTLGMRSILRLLCRDHTGLLVFETEGCYGGQSVGGGGLETQIFSHTNPGGMYRLQLWRPYHRSVLRMLYKSMESFKMAPEEAFEFLQFKVGGKPANWVHPQKDSIGIWQVPQDGDLQVQFSVEHALLKGFLQGSAILEDADFSGFLRRYYQETRFRPGFKKVIPLLALWTELDGNILAQRVYIMSLSKDFNLTESHLEHLCQVGRTMTGEVIARLLPCIPPEQASRFLLGHLFLSFSAFTETHKQMKNYMDFNMDNPTGHYILDLANCGDYAVAEQLLLLDRWEAAIDRKHGRKDISKLCNSSHVRNEVFQGRTLLQVMKSIMEWKLVEHGLFEFDYISNVRPKRKAVVLSDELWERILVETYQSRCTPEDKIATLRSISHSFFLRAVHMRAMIGYFKTENQRAEVFIIFYMRIVDMHNAKLFLVRFENSSEVVRLQERLGYASFFPFFQPENAKFELNLSVYDQRLCASMYVQLAIKEKFPHNLHDYGYRRVDGTEDPMILGVPRSWENINQIPKEGHFRATYMCAPEHRNFAHRKEIAKTWGFLDVHGLTEDDVQWWTGLTEPPEDVISLLEFLIGRFDNVEQPFIEIDGPGGNGQITLREFTEGLDKMECHKFDQPSKTGQRKDQRIDAVFRYLDPGGEGNVSREEWNILDQLWKEFDLSIREFVHFLCLSFNDNLFDAWDALDEDGSGELSEEEFLNAVVSIGYFGPAKVVFALLDVSDDGNISYDEFEVLEKYKPKRPSRITRGATFRIEG